MQRLDLFTQIVRHRRAMGFVLLKHFIAEGFAFGIKHHRNMAWLNLRNQAFQHIQHTIHGACRFTVGVGKRRESVKGAV